MLSRLGKGIVACLLFWASAHAYSAPKTVLVLGDSLSAEYGLSRGSGWVALLENKLRTEKADVKVVNASISGETSSGGRDRLPALLVQFRPDVVVIELGANDALRGLSMNVADRNLRDMVALSQQSKASVLLIGMRMPPNYGRDYTTRFFNMFQSIAGQTHSSLVPFMLDGVADKPTLFQPDRLHPNADAHPIILANIWPKLSPLVKHR